MRRSPYGMIETPKRGKLREGLSFGYVDVPETITPEGRPFLDTLTEASLALQKRIRRGKEIAIKTEDVIVDGLRVRVYIPDTNGPKPMAMYYHGGGFTIRDVECYDYIGRYLAFYSGAVLFMPDYDLCPERKFPVQLEQAYAALLWARGQGPFTADFVIGDSAGGNLAAAVSLLCRDRGQKVPRGQILAYPCLDMRIDVERESVLLYGKGYNLDAKHLVSYDKAYVDELSDLENPYASPLLASSLTGLPPCLMLSAECDVLVDQGMEYLKRLKDAGVPVRYKIFRGVPHDFLFFDYPESYAAYEMICRFIHDANS